MHLTANCFPTSILQKWDKNEIRTSNHTQRNLDTIMLKLTSQDLSFYQIFILIHFQNLIKLILMTFHYITAGYC